MPTSTTNQTAPSSRNNTPGDMGSLVTAGASCLENGDLRGALLAFEQVVGAFPDRPEGHNNLGALYNSMGEFEKAESCFTKVIEILPDNPAIYYNRGMARSSLEKYDTARSDFVKALAIDSRDTDCLNNLGVMDFIQGKFQDAKENFRKALAIKPDYPRALLNLCDVEMAEGHTTVAVDLCEEFLKTRNSVEVRRALLEMLSTGCRKSLDQASRTAQSLLAAGTDDPEISRKLDRIQKAKAVLEEIPEI